LDAAPRDPAALAEQTFTAPSLGGLSFRREVEKYMVYPESKMDEMGIFSPDWTSIDPKRAQLIEKYKVFGA
jgi:putative spermidine/putrescine transport system substrate-binding protein